MAKKNNTAEKTILDAEKIAKALKEGTEKSFQKIIAEAIDNMVADDDEKPEEVEDDSYNVEDVNDDEKEPKKDDEPAEDITPADGEAEEEDDAVVADAEGDENADEPEAANDSEFDDFKVGDDDYDFEGANGDLVLKVFNQLGDEDQIFIKKQNDGTMTGEGEDGTQYEIELDSNGAEDADVEPEVDADAEGEEPAEDAELDVEFDAEDPDADNADDDLDIEIDDDEENPEDEINEENLGYTTNYQKDVMPDLNMNEPANKKATYSMDKGTPNGNKRPYAGKGDQKPFGAKEDTIDECGGQPNECANLEEDGSGLNTKHAVKKSTNHINRQAQNQKVVSQDGEFKGNIQESVKKIVDKAKQIQAENKQYKAQLDAIKKSLCEAAVCNVALGKIVDLLVNETTTRAEKKTIVEKFKSVKTIAECKQVYDSIKTQLNESKSAAPILERTISAEGSQQLNETTIYNNPSLNLMERMDNLWK